MPLKNMTGVNDINPAACTPEGTERNWQATRRAIGIIINNLTELFEANGLQVGDTINGAIVGEVSQIPMQAKWAVAINDDPADVDNFIAPNAGNNWRGQIRAFPCDDSAGNNVDTRAIWVVLPERTDTSIHLPAGSIFAYEQTESGENVAISDYSAGDRSVIYYGVCQGDAQDILGVWQVVVKQCDDVLGNNPVAPDLTVYLPARTGYSPDLKSGDVISWTYGSDSFKTIVSDYTGDPIQLTGFYLNDVFVTNRQKLNLIEGEGISIGAADDGANEWAEYTISTKVIWAVAARQWEKNSGNPKVSMTLLTSYSGSTTGSPVDVYIRGNPGDMDPNVYGGQKLKIEVDADGTYFTKDPTAWDRKIGTVRQHLFDPEDLYVKNGSVILSGWLRMNGLDNATSNGGTGLDVENHFLYAKSQTGVDVDASDILDAETHSHAMGDTGATYTGVGVSDHPDHTHAVGCACTNALVDNTGSTYLGIVNFTDQHSPAGVFYTGVQNAAHVNGSTPHGSLTLSHTVVDPGHYHTGGETGQSGSNPAAVRLFFIERGDNSYEVLGI